MNIMQLFPSDCKEVAMNLLEQWKLMFLEKIHQQNESSNDHFSMDNDSRSQLLNLKMMKKDGSEMFISLTMSPIVAFFDHMDDTRKCLKSFSVVVHDVTIRKQLLDKTTAQLESKNTLIAHISHEFRCPIMSSMGSLELLRETDLNEKQVELLETIISSNSVLLLLVEDILQLLEFENKKENVKIVYNQRFGLDECLKSLKSIMFGYASQFSVNLEFDVEEGIRHLFVESNQSRLHQILSNLLTNAVKASHKDGTVELHCNMLEGNNISFKVRDYGSGIPKSKIESIFEPFVQLHNVNESKVPSSGLGLTTVLHIVKSMGGTIMVESEVGKGSTFTVVLPFKIINGSHHHIRTDSTILEDTRMKIQLNVQQNYLSLMNSTDTSVTTEIKGNAQIIIAEGK